ncbi:MAG: transglutaminase family protein [Bacteroidota bacterium]
MRFLFFAIFYTTFSFLQAQTVWSVDNIPPACMTNAGSVVRSSSTVFHVTAPGEAVMEQIVTITILNANGKAFNTWTEMEDNFVKVEEIKARLFDAAGNLVRESDKNDIRKYGGSEEYEFMDIHVKAIEMSYSNYPYTVEFRARKSVHGFFRIPDFVVQRLGQSVQQADFHITTPKDYPLRWKVINAGNLQPTEASTQDEMTRSWTFRDLPAQENEVHNPYLTGVYASIVLAPARVRIDDFSGDFSDWAGIGRFFFQLNQNRNHLSESMQETIRKLTQDKKSTREKVEALYRYLQENYRYVSIQIGIGGWQSFDADFVGKKKYGDCKALSNFMVTMLQYAGIDACQAIIYAGEEGAPDWYDEAPVPLSNHVVVYIPSENMWLECTSQSSPPGYLGSFTEGRQALLLQRDGGKLRRTPEPDPARNRTNTRTSLQIDENGATELESNLLAANDQHDFYRSLNRLKDKAEQEKQFTQQADFNISRLQNLRISVSAAKPEAGVEYKATLNNYATRSGKRMFVPLFKTNPFKRSLPADEQRQLDLQIRTCYTLSDTVEIRYPAAYIPENTPADKKIDSEFGSYETRINRDEAGHLVAIRNILIRPVAVPAARYNEVRQFYQAIAKADAAQLVLVRKD